jgi:hypothetical protein
MDAAMRVAVLVHQGRRKSRACSTEESIVTRNRLVKDADIL